MIYTEWITAMDATGSAGGKQGHTAVSEKKKDNTKEEDTKEEADIERAWLLADSPPPTPPPSPPAPPPSHPTLTHR
eukprot:3109449-Prymnesium_polylepis.1